MQLPKCKGAKEKLIASTLTLSEGKTELPMLILTDLPLGKFPSQACFERS